MKTFIYLIRHGESVGNLNKRVLGHTDLNLTEKGVEQAETTAKALRNVKFSAIYSSDLKRAYNTAKPNAEYRNMQIITSKELRELYFGDWENASVEMLAKECHDTYFIDWRQNFGTFTPPKGEYVQDLATRMYNKVLSIAEKHKGTNVLITSHAAAIRALWGKVAGMNPEEVGEKIPFPTNASYSILEYEDGILKTVSYSNDEHLLNCKPTPV